MLLKLLDFLNNQQYLEIVEYADQLLQQRSLKISSIDKELLQHLAHKRYSELLESLRKIIYSSEKNESYVLFLRQFEENGHLIQLQWQFAEKFDKTAPFVNLIIKKNILIYQPKVTDENPENFDSLNDFQPLIMESNAVLIGGEIYELKGMSSVDKLQAILRDANIQGEFAKYKKHEKMVNFLEALEQPLQELFSLHQIGVIIYNNEIYLVKWIQYLDENEMIDNSMIKSSPVSMIENFGVNIGIQINENLELGNLVIFSKKEQEDQKELLRPLFSLDESIFQGRFSKKPNQKWDLTQESDCKAFVENVLARIETGIMLLNKEKSAFLQKPQDMDVYIKITLQKVDAMDSINQRINILRDLLALNKNPDMFSKIQAKLETNYLTFLKQQFEFNSSKNIPGILKTLVDFKLFQEQISLLVHTLVYMFEANYADPDMILESVGLLESSWDLTSDLIQLLEKPQIIALTSNVIQLLNRSQFTEVLSYLTQYLKSHSRFRSYNIITLLIQIIPKIFRQTNQQQQILFDNSKFLLFFGEFVRIINTNEKSLSELDCKKLSALLEDHFNLITTDVDFLAFLNNKLIEYFKTVEIITARILRKKIIVNILRNFTQLSPLVMFQRNLPEIGWQCFDLLIKRDNEENLLQYFTQFVNIFTQSYQLMQKNSLLLNQSLKIFEGIKKFIGTKPIPKPFLLPLKKEVINLLNKWYLSGQMPESDFALHKDIIEIWADFVEFRDKLEMMMNILYLKDFIWTCYHNDLIEVRKKYTALPPALFEEHREELLIEFQTIFKTPYSTLGLFIIIHQLFIYLKQDYILFRLDSASMGQFITLFIINTAQALEIFSQDGDSNKFETYLSELDSDLNLFLPELYTSIYNALTGIFQNKASEGRCFIGRLEIINLFRDRLTAFSSDYLVLLEKSHDNSIVEEFIIKSADLDKIVLLFNDARIEMFKSSQDWLIQICEDSYATMDFVFNPIKNLFINILNQEQDQREVILAQISELINSFYNNEKMLTDNKKAFYRIIVEVLPENQNQAFYPRLRNEKELFDELNDLESNYYYIKDTARDAEKIISVMNRSWALIQKNPNIFNPWFFYANCLTLQGQFTDAIEAYKEAAKKKTTRGNLSRLIQNLIVCYMSIEDLESAVELVKSLDIGLKIYLQSSTIIHQLEQRTGESLLA